jgi:hypothetical protein
MKKLLLSLSVALLALFYASCSTDGGNGSPAEDWKLVYKKNGTPYTGSGKVYMANKQDSMLEIGAMSNGKITLSLPAKVDLFFLEELDSEFNAEPPDSEAWLYVYPLRLVNSAGEHIGDLEYEKITNSKIHKMSYWYFSKDTRINASFVQEENNLELQIDAKKGWNKVHYYALYDVNIVGLKIYMTTDLSEVPDDLKWVITEK